MGGPSIRVTGKSPGRPRRWMATHPPQGGGQNPAYRSAHRPLANLWVIVGSVRRVSPSLVPPSPRRATFGSASRCGSLSPRVAFARIVEGFSLFVR